MPELPEVETIRSQFEKEVVGRKIVSLDVRLPKMIKGSADDFVSVLSGASFTAARRRSKILIFDLDNGCSLLVHLKMSGQLYRVPASAEITKHTHTIFRLDDGTDLRHRDVRQFGYLKLVRQSDLGGADEIKKLGPEPLTPAFTLEAFTRILARKPRSKIKSILLDQSLVSGIGNIYSDEALFESCIHPQRQSCTLSEIEMKNLYEAILMLLSTSIKRRGTSVDLYVDLHGEKGENQNHLKVYGNAGKPCVRCGHEIERIKVAGRGTYFCPICQK